MKKLYKETMVIGTAAAVLLLCGCSEQQEAQQAATDGRVSTISVSVSHGATRAGAANGATRATAADMTSVGRLSAFNSGDTFLAFMPTAARHTSAPYQVSSSGGDTYAATVCAGYEPLSAPSVDGTPLYGYYPYSTDGTAYGGVRVTDASATFTVQQDQTTADAYEQSDLMYAAGPVNASGVAALTFRHQMAQLVLRPYSASDYTDGTDGHPTLTMKSLEIVSGSRTVALATMPALTIGETRGDAMTPAAPLQVFSGSQALSYYADQTTAGATTGGATPYYCLVPPQQLSQSTAFIRLECEASYGGGAPQTFSVTYRLTADRTLASGSSYTLPLPVTPVATDVEIAAWSETAWTETTDLDYGSGNYANSGNMAFTVGGVPFNMVYVEGGGFTMPVATRTAENAIGTVYHVKGSLSDYYIGETEVTEGLWKAINTSSAYTNGASYPKLEVPYNSAQSFVNQLNAATESQRPAGWVFSLPTEMQWMYAARGGQKGVENGTFDYEWVGFNTKADAPQYGVMGYSTARLPAQPVASKKPNALGIYDMAGNAWEFCIDNWREYTTDNEDIGHDYCYDAANSTFIFHSGSFGFSGADLVGAMIKTRVQGSDKNSKSSDFGFRVALVKRKPRVGDLYFSDGTWGTKQEWPVKAAGGGTVKPVGIVFSTTTSAKDRAAGYYNGYVLALGRSNAEKFSTAATSTGYATDGITTNETATPANIFNLNVSATGVAIGRPLLASDLDGRSHCEAARRSAKFSDMAAIQAALSYSQHTAPDISSGWYLPSIGQHYLWITAFTDAASGTWTVLGTTGYQKASTDYRSTINSYITSRLSSASQWATLVTDDGVNYGWMWSSSMHTGGTAWGFYLQNNNTYFGQFPQSRNDFYVRPVLAF